MGNFVRATSGNGEDVSPSEELLASAPGFTSQEEMLAATRDPRYKTDSYYRHLIEACTAHTDPAILGLNQQHEHEEDDSELIEAQRDTVQAYFRDPRYKTDAGFRRKVAEMVGAHSPSSGVPAGGVTRVELGGKDGWSKVSNFSALRIEQEPMYTPADAPENSGKPLDGTADNDNNQ